jgi:hypothetical protein
LKSSDTARINQTLCVCGMLSMRAGNATRAATGRTRVRKCAGRDAAGTASR